jgi:hypothetical protein
MKYALICLFLAGCATPETPRTASKVQAYNLNDHAKSGRGDSRSYLKVNKPIGASHPLSRQ